MAQIPRTSQITLEVMEDIPGIVRTSQITLEVMEDIPGIVRTSQITLEVMITNISNVVNVIQASVHVIGRGIKIYNIC